MAGPNFPAVEPEVAVLLTNDDGLCEKTITLLLKISSSIVQQPHEKRVRSLNLSSRAVEFTLLPANGALELLFLMGFKEANDRLVMPEDACLNTVKLYQEQLHQLLSWKTSNSHSDHAAGISGPPSISASLHSPCPSSSNNSSPASIRSHSSATGRGTTGSADRKRTASGGSNASGVTGGGKKEGRSPNRATSAASGKAASSPPKGTAKQPGGSTPGKSSQQSPSVKSTLISNSKSKVLQSSQENSSSKNGTTKAEVNANKISAKAGNLTNKNSSQENKNTVLTNGIASSKSSTSIASKSATTKPKQQVSSSSKSALTSQAVGTGSKAMAPPLTNGVSNSSSSSQSATSASTTSDASGSSSTPSSMVAPPLAATVAPAAAAAVMTPTSSTGATAKKIAPHKLRAPTTWLSRFTGYLQRVLTYEEPAHQAKARALIPFAKLHSRALQRLKAQKEEEAAVKQVNVEASKRAEKMTPLVKGAASGAGAVSKGAVEKVEKEGPSGTNKNAAKPFDHNDHLVVELTLWFKHDFFKWFDSGWCSSCHCNMASKGTLPPTKHELEGEANNVEFYQCQRCGAGHRFPRYLNVGRLLETKEGRCGEWASCFTLCCRTLGFDARQVFDETDHTWTEVWSVSQSRWVHVDPCEGRVDCPLLYECGWGKQLSYVVAASRDEVMDVTWRYTLLPLKVKERRTKVTEEDLWQHLWSLTLQLQQQHQQHTRHQLHLRMVREMATFLAPQRPPTKEELEGRTTGSLGWRVSRGETGVLHTTPHHTFTLHHTARLTTLIVRYNPARDVYMCEGTVGPPELQGWQAGVHTATNLALKKEQDWHNVYLARTEGETGTRSGEVVWRVRWESARVALDAVHIILRHTLFHNATVTWSVSINGEDYPGDHTGELRITNLCCKAANKAAVGQQQHAAPGDPNANTLAGRLGVNAAPASKGPADKGDNKNANKPAPSAAVASNNKSSRDKSLDKKSSSSGSKGGAVNKNDKVKEDTSIINKNDRGKSPNKGKSGQASQSRFSIGSRSKDNSNSSIRNTSKSPIRLSASNASSKKTSSSPSHGRDAGNGSPAAASCRNDSPRGPSVDNLSTRGLVDSNSPRTAPDSSVGAVDREGNSRGGELEVRAVLAGGEGDNAWQHAQLFRLRDNEFSAVPFLIDLQFQ